MVSNRRMALAGAIVCILVLPASAETLRVGCYGGVMSAVQKKFTADLFTERTGVKVEFIDASPKTHLAKLIAGKQQGQPAYDLVYLDEDVQVEAIDAGVFEKIDPKIVTNLSQLHPGTANPQGYGPAILMASIGIAYNKEKFRAAGIPEPKSWEDLWDPRLAGHVAAPNIDNLMGRDFIVAAAKLAGGNENQLEKGIDKIAQLKAQSYYLSSTELQAKFQSGDVWAAPWTNGRAWGMATRGQPIGYVLPKEGGFADFGTLDVAKGSPNAAAAQAYINFALEPIAQLGNAYEMSFGPTNKVLVPVLAAYPKLAETFPSSPDDMKKLNHVDWRKFSKQYPRLLELWNRNVATK